MATVLEMTLFDLLSYDGSESFNHCIQHHVMGSNNTYHENGLKERELYEARIKVLEEVVAELRKDKGFSAGSISGGAPEALSWTEDAAKMLDKAVLSFLDFDEQMVFNKIDAYRPARSA